METISTECGWWLPVGIDDLDWLMDWWAVNIQLMLDGVPPSRHIIHTTYY